MLTDLVQVLSVALVLKEEEGAKIIHQGKVITNFT